MLCMWVYVLRWRSAVMYVSAKWTQWTFERLFRVTGSGLCRRSLRAGRPRPSNLVGAQWMVLIVHWTTRNSRIRCSADKQDGMGYTRCTTSRAKYDHNMHDTEKNRLDTPQI